MQTHSEARGPSLALLELEVETSSAWRSNTIVRLEERLQALEREPSDVAAHAERVRTEVGLEAEAWAAACGSPEQEETRWAQVADAINGERVRWEQGARGALQAGGGPGRSRGGRPVRPRAALQCPALLAQVRSRNPCRRCNSSSRHI